MKTGDIQMIRSNQSLTESPSQESVMFRVEKETTKYFFSREKVEIAVILVRNFIF